MEVCEINNIILFFSVIITIFVCGGINNDMHTLPRKIRYSCDTEVEEWFLWQLFKNQNIPRLAIANTVKIYIPMKFDSYLFAIK